jgi:RecJ-like exonuclease
MPRPDVARDSDSCPECRARFIAAPCRLCKGTGQSLLFFRCKDCGGTGKKTVCPNFLSHLRAQSGSQPPSPKRHAIMQCRR